MKIKLLSALLGVLKTTSKDPVTNTLGELHEIVGVVLGDDATKKKYDDVVDKIKANSQNVVTRTARGALMWALGITLVYHSVVRDILAMAFNVDLFMLDTCDLTGSIIQLLSNGM